MPREDSAYSLGTLRRKRADGTSYWHYVMRWADAGGPRRVSLGTNDRPTAESLARDLWARRRPANADDVGGIVTGWLTATDGTRGHKRSAEAWKAAAKFWANVPPNLIDAAMCRSYAAQRKRAANTIRNELSTIRSALKWAGVAHAPMWMPPMPESSVEHLTKTQFRKFLSGCTAPHVALFAQIAVATGARSTALLELQWDRVDLDRRLINLNPRGQQQVANKRRATVPINDQLAPLLEAAKEGAQGDYVIEYHGEKVASIKKGFAAAAARSGVHCTPHMLRHSAAVWMAEARTPMDEIASYLGHTNTSITAKVYARFSPDYLQRAAKALTW